MKIMENLGERFFKNYSLITYASNIYVIRANKFVK